MKVRYSVDESGQLVDRNGNVLGRVTSLTLEVAEGRGAMGGGVPSQETSLFPSERSDRTEGGAGETTTDPRIEIVWAHWVQHRKPRRTELEPSQAKLIAKALKVATVVELNTAIDALLADDWHRERGLLHLSTLLSTRPGGPTLRDQIDRWLDRAPGNAQTSPGAAEGLRPRRNQDELDQLIRATRSKARRPPYPPDLADFVPERERERLARRDELAEQLRTRFGVIVTFAGDDDHDPSFRDE